MKLKKLFLAALIFCAIAASTQVPVFAQPTIDLARNTKGNLPVDSLVHGLNPSYCLQMDGTAAHVIWAACPGGGGGGSGTVTLFSASGLSPLFTVSVSNPTTTPALSFALSNAAAHSFFGNNTGATAAPAFVSITAADLPGVFPQSLANVLHKWLNSYDASTGLFTQTQPAYSDLTGTPTLPSSLANVLHKWLNSYDASTGLFTQTQPDYGDLTGVPSTFAPSAHNLLSSAHGDTTAAGAVRGDGLFAIGATPTWQHLAHPATSGGYFKWNGTDVVASSNAAAGTGSCTNQVVTAENADAAPTCSTVTSAMTSGTFSPAAHNLLSASHGDTSTASAVRGDGLFAIGATPTWQRLAHPATTGGYFKWNGTDVVASSGAAAGTGTPTACSNQFVTSLTDNADAAPTTVCTTATLASAQFANQGTTTTVLHGNAAGNPSFASVARADLAAGAKNWAFCGTATGATTTVGPVNAGTCCSAGTCTEFMIEYLIKGYNGGTPVGRILMGPGTPSTTALNNGCTASEGVTAPTSEPSIPGCPLAVTLSAIARHGWIFISGPSGSLKSIDIFGQNGNPAVATPPTLYRSTGVFSDLSTNVALQQFQLTVYDTLTATAASAQTFTSGTAIWVWGRNAD